MHEHDSSRRNPPAAEPLPRRPIGAAEEFYWEGNIALHPAADGDLPFADYLAAYRLGWLAHERHPGRPFEDVEPELRAGWGQPDWGRARFAARDAWERLERWQADRPFTPAESLPGF
jgi:hypothetical protein